MDMDSSDSQVVKSKENVTVLRKFPIVDDESLYNREEFLQRRKTMATLLGDLWEKKRLSFPTDRTISNFDFSQYKCPSQNGNNVICSSSSNARKIIRKSRRDIHSMADAEIDASLNHAETAGEKRKSLWQKVRKVFSGVFGIWKGGRDKIQPDQEFDDKQEQVRNKGKLIRKTANIASCEPSAPLLRNNHQKTFCADQQQKRPNAIFGDTVVMDYAAAVDKDDISVNSSSESISSLEFSNKIDVSNEISASYLPAMPNSDCNFQRKTMYNNPHLTDSFVNLTFQSTEYMDNGEFAFSDANSSVINRKRFYNVCVELVSTEESFIEDMKIVIELFYRPFLDKKWIKERDANILFSNLVQILPVNQLFYQALRQNFDENGIFGIGDIFLSMADYFKIYTIYCSNHGLALSTLEACLSKSEGMRIYTNELYKQPEFRGLNLQSFLLKPIQRICKYPLFLKELLKFTFDENEREVLELAYGKIQTIVNTVNQKSEEAIEVQKTVQALSKIKFKKSFILESRSRKLLLENSFLLSMKESMHPTSWRKFYLFSDVIIVAKSIAFSRGKFSCCMKISLEDGIDFEDMELDHPYGGLYCIKLCSRKTGKTFFLYSEDAEKLYKWQVEVEKALPIASQQPHQLT